MINHRRTFMEASRDMEANKAMKAGSNIETDRDTEASGDFFEQYYKLTGESRRSTHDTYNYPDGFDEGLEHILEYCQNHPDQPVVALNMYANEKLKDYVFAIACLPADAVLQAAAK